MWLNILVCDLVLIDGILQEWTRLCSLLVLLIAKVHHSFNVSDLANLYHILLLVQLVIAELSWRSLFATLTSLLFVKVRLHVQNLQLLVGVLPLLLSGR